MALVLNNPEPCGPWMGQKWSLLTNLPCFVPLPVSIKPILRDLQMFNNNQVNSWSHSLTTEFGVSFWRNFYLSLQLAIYSFLLTATWHQEWPTSVFVRRRTWTPRWRSSPKQEEVTLLLARSILFHRDLSPLQ